MAKNKTYKTCAWPKDVLGGKPGKAILNCSIPILTTRPELRKLMTHEFHKPGQAIFDDTEVENFRERLSCPQLALLSSKTVKTNRITAFITFGDGAIDRLMGATYTYDDLDLVRPNASLAFFNKGEDGKVELLFYTRFFVMSYFTKIKKTPELDTGAECRKLGAKSLSEPERQNLFKLMSKIRVVKRGCVDVQDWRVKPERYAFVIEKVVNRILGRARPLPSIDGYIPFIRLRYAASPGKRVQWFSPGNQENGMHGIIDTHSCWMLFRNHLWNWPDEEKGHAKFTGLYSSSQRGDNWASIQTSPDLSALKSAPGFPAANRHFSFYNGWRNYSYIPMLNLLAGLKYDGWNPLIYQFPDLPSRTAGAANCYGKQASPRWGANILGQHAANGSWADVFLFRRTVRFTKDSGDTDEFS